jgi:hypothetical protein
MIVECGWCKRIIEALDEDDELRTAKAIDIYSRHVIVEHPERIYRDQIVRMWIEAQAARLAMTNGALTHGKEA